MKRIKGKMKVCLIIPFIFIYLFLSFQCKAQSALIESHLTPGEKKKLANADKTEAESLTLRDKSDSQMSMGQNVKAEETLEKATLKQQVANARRIEIYKTKLEEFKKTFKEKPSSIANGLILEDQANEYFNKAIEIRKNASVKAGSEGQKLLRQANDYEKDGITRQIEALNYYYTWPVEYKSDYLQTNDESENNNKEIINLKDSFPLQIQIDSTQLMAFQRYLNSDLPAYDSASNRYMTVSSFDSRSLTKAWYSYLYGPDWQKDTSLREVADYVNDGSKGDIPLQTGKNLFQKSHDKSMNSTGENIKFAGTNTSLPGTSNFDILKNTDENGKAKTIQTMQNSTGISNIGLNGKKSINEDTSNNITGINSGKNRSVQILYKVQVAANKNPLSQNLLRKIYSGNKEITEINEDGWHKYAIGDFTTWEEADLFRKNCGVADAFIMKENRVDINGEFANIPNKTIEKIVPLNSEIEFRVQIAASRKSLSESDVKQIYQGNRPVKSSIEDGWYKYFIAILPSYEDAKKIKTESGVRKAFIAAYLNGERTDLYSAIHPSGEGKTSEITITSTTVQSSGKIWYVQLAASKIPLSVDFFRQQGISGQNLLEIREENWYKYRLGPFISRPEALNTWKKFPPENAFIVAYNDGIKTSGGPSFPSAQKKINGPDISVIMPVASLAYYLQIAATHTHASPKSIQKICPACDIIYEYSEDGMFKYLINTGTDYVHAIQLKNELKIPGSFLVAFSYGKKISINDSLKLEK